MTVESITTFNLFLAFDPRPSKKHRVGITELFRSVSAQSLVCSQAVSLGSDTIFRYGYFHFQLYLSFLSKNNAVWIKYLCPKINCGVNILEYSVLLFLGRELTKRASFSVVAVAVLWIKQLKMWSERYLWAIYFELCPGMELGTRAAFPSFIPYFILNLSMIQVI